MSAYRLSPLRNKGWLRAGLIAATLTLPIALIEYSLGYFNDGVQGLIQAAEFVSGGAVVAMMIGMSAPWVLRGFAVRTKEDDADDERTPAAGGMSAASPATDAKGRRPAPAPRAPGARH